MNTTIDWKALEAVESRLVTNDTEILTCRLQRLLALEQKHHNERTRFSAQTDSDETQVSLQDMRQITSPESSEPSAWKDIPRLEYGDYRDDELELWHAVINDYCGTLLKIPKYVSSSIWAGIPPSLRGRVWQTLAGIDSVELDTLQSLYEGLATEWTPSVKIIGRDLNRTFPSISLFREKDGAGQRMLGRVMRAYSAYDIQVGYCQGLTFLAGPLLLHMNDKSAFCVLVKLMEDYDLRSMFTADMAGLHLRVFQFERLVEEQLPRLYQHFTNLDINLLCTSQWFLSMFAVTCPLDMLVRIYDIIFAEGAIVTLMRTAIAVLKRNEEDLCEFENEEDVQYRLLSAALWDVFDNDADVLMRDIRQVSAEETLRGLEQAKFLYNEKTASLARKESQARKRLSMKRMGSTKKHKFQLALHKPILPIVVPCSERSSNNQQSNVADPIAGDLQRPSNQRSLSTFTHLPGGSKSCSNLSNAPPSPPPDQLHNTSQQNILALEERMSANLSRHGSIASSNSASSRITTSTTATSALLDDDELQRVKSNLDSERHEREVDKDLLETLLACLPRNVVDEDVELASTIQLLRARFRIKDDAADEESNDANLVGNSGSSRSYAGCKNCERLMQDLASARVKETTLRVKVDDLEDRLGICSSQEAEAKSNQTSKASQKWFWARAATPATSQ